ncbi:MAG: SpoIIE family protein phosphatase [Spirochaetia bacterium]|nr:SpoIIE family protein phosphatase [Spirochaetia bacterium]
MRKENRIGFVFFIFLTLIIVSIPLYFFYSANIKTSDFFLDINNLNWNIVLDDNQKFAEKFEIENSIPLNGNLKKETGSNKAVWLQTKINSDKKPIHDLILFLGQIILADETFFNGHIIGKTGKLDNNYNEILRADDIPRIYNIPKEYFKLGENLLSIKIYLDKENNLGGFKKEEHRFIISNNKFFENYIEMCLPEIILTAIILVVSLYHFLLYFEIPAIKENLFFGLFSIIMFMYFGLNSPLKYFWMPENMVYIMKQAEIILSLLSPSLFIIFLHYLYLNRVKKSNYKWFIPSVIQLFFLLIILITNKNYSLWIKLVKYNTYIISFQIIYVFFLSLSYTVKKHQYSFIVFAGITIFLFSVLYDMLASYGFITFLGYLLMPYGFAFLILSIGYLLSQRYVDIYHKTESLNLNLEKEVIERTKNLNLAKQKLEKQNKEYQKELKLAKEIQHNILPSANTSFKNLEINSLFIPMGELSGDYYDFFPIDNNQYAIVICDVSGHGIPAALISMMLKLVFSDMIKKSTSPSFIFKEINNYMNKYLMLGDFFSSAMVIIDTNKNELKYSSGGHWPILVQKLHGEIIELGSTGPLLGIQKDMEYEEKEIRLDKKDKIVFYSDGIIDTQNNQGEEYGIERLKNFMKLNINSSIKNLIENFKEELIKFHNSFSDVPKDSFSDDITMLIAGYKLN